MSVDDLYLDLESVNHLNTKNRQYILILESEYFCESFLFNCFSERVSKRHHYSKIFTVKCDHKELLLPNLSHCFQ